MIRQAIALAAGCLALATTFGCETIDTAILGHESMASVHRRYEAELADCEADVSDLEEKLRACLADAACKDQVISDLQRQKAERDRQIAVLQDELAKRGGRGGSPAATMSILNDVLFDSGSAVIKPGGRRVLDEAARVIKRDYAGKKIMVEGHTDTDPIVNSPWRSNWELGAGRSLAVLHYLEENHGIQGTALAASSFSFHRPVSSDKSENRRTLLVIYDRWPSE